MCADVVYVNVSVCEGMCVSVLLWVCVWLSWVSVCENVSVLVYVNKVDVCECVWGVECGGQKKSV